MDNIFIQLAFSLTLACLFGLLVLRLKLPLVVAYLLAGVSLSLVSIFDPRSSVIFEILPEIGIAFVLFLIGMELDLREVRALGRPIIISALGQIVISTAVGFVLAGLLGFSQIESILLGLGLSFSSTIVVIKMLLEKRDLLSLYGKLAVGILLVEDLVAILVLMMISVSGSTLHLGFTQSLPLVALVAKGIGLFILTYFLAKFVLVKLFDYVAKSVELLFLTAITWCFAFTALSVLAGFSVVIGAFLAGVALASSPYHLQIQGKIKPLRDFFLTLFFIYLGLQANVADFLIAWPAIILFTGFAILVKPLIYLLLLGIFGFRKHTLFHTALNLSQVSEFSLVVLVVALQTGNISSLSLSVMAAVAVISIILSTIMIAYSRKIYSKVSGILPVFENAKFVHSLEMKLEDPLEDHVVVIGANRIGGPIIKFLKSENISFVVMDFNPHIVEDLREKQVRVIYGDVGDPEVVSNLRLESAKLIISTVMDLNDTEVLLEECKRKKVRAKIIVRAQDPDHAKSLEALGADYAILPEKVSAEYIVEKLKNVWLK